MNKCQQLPFICGAICFGLIYIFFMGGIGISPFKGFTTLGRLILMVFSLIIAYQAERHQIECVAWIFGGFAFVFNPIILGMIPISMWRVFESCLIILWLVTLIIYFYVVNRKVVKKIKRF